METVVLAIPDTKEAEIRGAELVEQARAFSIKTDDDFRLVDAHRAGCRALIDEIKAVFDPIAEAQYKAHKLTTSTRAKLLEAPEAALKLDGQKLAAYQAEQERIKAELEAESRAKAEAERKALEAEAEKLAEAGNFEAARETILATREIVHEEIPVTKLAATGFRDVWRAEVVKFSDVPDTYKLPNQSALDALAKATKGTADVPGVRFWCEKVAVSKRGK